MKKKIILIVLLLVLGLLSAPVFAQVTGDFYTKSVAILKILSHELGYKIFYLKCNADVASFYVPISWFRGTSGKASLIWGHRKEYPYFSIFWKDNEFVHLKLFLQENMADESWGVLEDDNDTIRENFEIEALDLEF